MSTLAGAIKLQSTMIETLADDTTRTGTLAVDLGINKVTTYSDGTAASKVNRAFYREFSAAATPVVYNLATLTCNDGSTGMAYVREVLIVNDDTVDGHDLTVGAGTTPFPLDLGGTSPTVKIRAGTAKRVFSKPLGTTGLAVSTTVNITIDPGANTVAGRIEVLGHN